MDQAQDLLIEGGPVLSRICIMTGTGFALSSIRGRLRVDCGLDLPEPVIHLLQARLGVSPSLPTGGSLLATLILQGLDEKEAVDCVAVSGLRGDVTPFLEAMAKARISLAQRATYLKKLAVDPFLVGVQLGFRGTPKKVIDQSPKGLVRAMRYGFQVGEFLKQSPSSKDRQLRRELLRIGKRVGMEEGEMRTLALKFIPGLGQSWPESDPAFRFPAVEDAVRTEGTPVLVLNLDALPPRRRDA